MFRLFKQEKRIVELEERVSLLERALKHIDVEWTNTYEKFRQLNMRVAKRAKALEELEEDSPTGEGTQAVGPEEVAGSSGLSAAQLAANAAVLARRSRRNGG